MLRSMVMALIAGQAKELTRRVRSAALLNLLAVIFATVGAGFLVGAGFIVAANRYGTLESAIGFAIGFLAVAALLFAVNAIQSRAWKRRQEQMQANEMKTLAATALIAALPGLLKSKSGLAGILLPIAGLVALKIYDENRDRTEDNDET